MWENLKLPLEQDLCQGPHILHSVGSVGLMKDLSLQKFYYFKVSILLKCPTGEWDKKDNLG